MPSTPADRRFSFEGRQHARYHAWPTSAAREFDSLPFSNGRPVHEANVCGNCPRNRGAVAGGGARHGKQGGPGCQGGRGGTETERAKGPSGGGTRYGRTGALAGLGGFPPGIGRKSARHERV